MRHALRGRATRSTGLPRSDLGVAYATARRALAPPARAAVAVGSLPRPAPSALTCENGRAAGGKVYLAVVLDAWSRMVIGWSIADHIRSGLVVDALQMAIWRRRPAQGKTICHTDHGSQYTSWAFGRRLRAAGLLGSRGSIGDCFDNSLAESFFGTLQLELLDRHHWETRDQLASAIFEYVEAFYDPHRRHSSIENFSPAEFESRHTAAADAA